MTPYIPQTQSQMVVVYVIRKFITVPLGDCEILCFSDQCIQSILIYWTAV